MTALEGHPTFWAQIALGRFCGLGHAIRAVVLRHGSTGVKPVGWFDECRFATEDVRLGLTRSGLGIDDVAVRMFWCFCVAIGVEMCRPLALIAFGRWDRWLTPPGRGCVGLRPWGRLMFGWVRLLLAR